MCVRVRACVCACVRACAFAGSKLRGISESGLSRSDSSLSASSGSLLGDDLSDEMEEEIREVSFLSTLPCRHNMGVESAHVVGWRHPEGWPGVLRGWTRGGSQYAPSESRRVGVF